MSIIDVVSRYRTVLAQTPPGPDASPDSKEEAINATELATQAPETPEMKLQRLRRQYEETQQNEPSKKEEVHSSEPSKQLNLFTGQEDIPEYHCGEEGCDFVGTPDDMEYDATAKRYFCPAHDVKCGDCGERVSKDDSSDVRGSDKPVCSGCRDDDYFYCEECGEYVPNNDYVGSSDQFKRRRPRDADAHHMGCDECSSQCESCGRAQNKDHMTPVDRHMYCENCFSENFTYCEDCKDNVPSDEARSDDDGNSYCYHHYNERYITCDECDGETDKEESYSVENDRGRDVEVCQECYNDKYNESGESEDGLPKLPNDYSTMTPIASVQFNRKLRPLSQIIRLLPITIRDLKVKYPSIAQSCKDLLNFAKSKPITIDIVKQYQASLPKDNYQISYGSWGGLQRSLNRSQINRSQLVIKIKAGPEIQAKINEDSITKDLFEKINWLSKKSGHPFADGQIGWARIEIDPEGKYMLVDEIQIDHMNAIHSIKSGKDKAHDIALHLQKTYGLTQEQLNEKLDKLMSIIREFPDVAVQVVSQFALANNIPKIFWHEYQSSKRLKGNNPPKSFYTKTPEENGFEASSDKPFGLDGNFFEREAARRESLLATARYFELLNV